MKIPLFSVVKEAALQWNSDGAPRLAAALAFYTILSVTPLFVIVTAVSGFFFGAEAANGQLFGQLRGFLGDAGADVVRTAVLHADKPKSGVMATIIGAVTLLFGASGVFGELQSALNSVWNVRPKNNQGIWGTVRNRFASFGMVLVVGFLLLVSLVISAGISALGNFTSGILSETGIILQILNFVVSFGVVTVLFALIFKVLPDVRIGWRDVWIGAATTATLFTIGKYLIGLYLGKAGVASPFGAAGSLVAFVVWVYYSGLILFFGAEITQVVMKRFGRSIEPSANAEMTPS